jgi:hypothetical protein
VEKRRLFHVFLKQFLVVYKNWEPINGDQFSEAVSSPIQPEELMSCSYDVVVGCSAGHPAEIISMLAEEVTILTSIVTECKLNLYVLYLGFYFD